MKRPFSWSSRFILVGALFAALVGSLAFPRMAAAASSAVSYSSATVGSETRYNNNNGDTWYTTWADDGNLYTTNDDGNGFGSCNSNLAINVITGNDPTQLSGSSVNCMQTGNWNYGSSGDTQGNPDGRTWKVGGILAVDGALYLSISRHMYSDPAYGGRQDAQNATIIRSTDHGQTWSGSEANSYANPMFPGTRFSNPDFIQYGQNYSGTADGADQYVYALSNDGFWNNGDSLILGRVARSVFANLNGSDWQYYAGNGNWTSDMNQAVQLVSTNQQMGQVSVQYIPSQGVYVMAAWYYPEGPGTTTHTTWDFYQAPHPWGPWSKFATQDFKPGGYYNPVLVSKFTTSNGNSVIFTTGNYWNPSTYYRLSVFPVTFANSNAEQIVNDSDPGISYLGSDWTSASNRGFGDYLDDAHYTQNNGDSAEFTFTGTGVDYIAETNVDEGNVDIYIDNVYQTTVNGYSSSRIGQVTLYSNTNLPEGQHTIEIVKSSGQYMLLDAFRLYSQPITNDTDAAISYNSGGGWVYSPGRGFGDFQDDVHYTQNNGDSATFTFTGSGIQYIAEVYLDEGNVDVYIDGTYQQTVSGYASERLGQSVLYSNLSLSRGQHTITLVKSSGQYMLVDAFRVYP